MISKFSTRLNYCKKKIFIVTLLLTLLTTVRVQGFESSAKSALVIDNLTGNTLLEKNSRERIPPASMSKLMTLYMVFDALRHKRLLLTDKIKVSAKASQKGGSKMFLNEGQMVSIEDIIKGIIIHSGNDACIAVAETLSGTEAEFAKDMTEKAKTLGLTNSFFTNSTGWPDENHYMSAQDLTKIATIIRTEFPNYYPYFSEKSFTWNKITQENRNPLLLKGLGADGLKTGHAEEAGYGLVGSAKRGNRRITFVLSGLESKRGRTTESEKIVNWAYRDFTAKRILKKNQPIGKMPVWLGTKKEAGLSVDEDIYVLVPKAKESQTKVQIAYNSPMTAPFDIGDRANAKLKVSTKIGSKTVEKEYDLYLSESSESGSFLTRMYASMIILKNHVKQAIK